MRTLVFTTFFKICNYQWPFACALFFNKLKILQIQATRWMSSLVI